MDVHLKQDRRAELTLLLTVTGMNLADAARYVEVQDRTMRRWLNDEQRDIPQDVLDKLRELDRWIDELAASLPPYLMLPDRPLTRINTQGMPLAAYKMACARAWLRRGRISEIKFEP